MNQATLGKLVDPGSPDSAGGGTSTGDLHLAGDLGWTVRGDWNCDVRPDCRLPLLAWVDSDGLTAASRNWRGLIRGGVAATSRDWRGLVHDGVAATSRSWRGLQMQTT